MFKAVAETLSELASDKKYLGAKIGFSSVLHTWGQNFMHHPTIFTALCPVADYLPPENG